ncbi:major histocompatibility complex class I-related gene protein-like isoform X2 [Parambassis ranga]|uniref:Major histocompatibility complex class I-related gene protein-like isoform X2 n=1 Tax=Parambassis ranga TaxID=210632 RepID=A0A6P7K0S3_9TELE|nr:major histocompatibility complex class I-related gene protein-like isoform X2 [Parambassis ranga]
MELMFLLVLFHTTHSVKHSLTYFITSSSGLQNFPRFVAVSKVDGVYVAYCDSSNHTAEPRQDWTKTLMEEEPEHLEWHIQTCLAAIQDSKTDIDHFKQHFNHTGGVHVFQELSSCEWDNETDETSGYQRFGYDREDVVSVDSKTLTWKFTEKAAFFKQTWDEDKSRLSFTSNFFTNICPQWLKQYIVYGRKYLLRKGRITCLMSCPYIHYYFLTLTLCFFSLSDRPSVSLLQKTPSSAVSCHATGFYPDRALMFWSKDGEEIHEGVEHGEILPNHDGTFQMTVDLNVSSVPEKDWRRYHCEFQFEGVKDRIITELDEAVIRTNSKFPAGVLVGVVVGLLLLLLCMAALLLWKKNKNGFRAASTSESS